MASGHDKNFKNDQNSSSSGTVGKSGNLNDSSSLAEKNVLGIKQGSEIEFNPYHGNESSALQYLLSSSHQTQSYERKSFPFHSLQPKDIQNIPESSHSLYHKSPDDIPSKAQEAQLFSDKRDKSGPFTVNEDAVPHIQSGTEFSETQNTHSYRQDLNVQQASKDDDLHAATIECYGNVSKESQQFFSKRDNRCNAIRKQSKTELGVTEFSETTGSDPAAQQFAESNKSRFKECDSLTRPQSWNEPIASQSTHPLFNQPHQSVSNIGQTAHSMSLEVVQAQLATIIPRYIPRQGESRNPLDLSWNPECNSKDTQNILPQGPQQSESDPNMIRTRNSSGHQTSEINLIQGHGLNEPTTEVPNQSIVKQDLHSMNRQKVESETHQSHLLRALLENPQKRHLPPSYAEHQLKKGLYSNPLAESQPSTGVTFRPLPGNRQLPSSHPEQQSNRVSSTVPLAESQPDMPDTYPLPDTFLQLDSFTKRDNYMYSNKAAAKVHQEDVDLRMLQRPYSNRFEQINIFVCGHPKWSDCLLKTFSGSIRSDHSLPYYCAFNRNVIRCGISMKVLVWKINNFIESTSFLISYCLSSKSTFVLVDSVADMPHVTTAIKRREITPEIKHSIREQLASRLQWLTDFMPTYLGRNVSIVLALSEFSQGILGNRSGNILRTILDLTYMGFGLKAKHNISAYMECFVDSAEEVEAVMRTAIDVSFL